MRLDPISTLCFGWLFLILLWQVLKGGSAVSPVAVCQVVHQLAIVDTHVRTSSLLGGLELSPQVISTDTLKRLACSCCVVVPGLTFH